MGRVTLLQVTKILEKIFILGSLMVSLGFWGLDLRVLLNNVQGVPWGAYLDFLPLNTSTIDQYNHIPLQNSHQLKHTHVRLQFHLFDFRVIAKCCWNASTKVLVQRKNKWLTKLLLVVSPDYLIAKAEQLIDHTANTKSKTDRDQIFATLLTHLYLVNKPIIELEVPCKKNHW